jgi:hypothetical protein
LRFQGDSMRFGAVAMPDGLSAQSSIIAQESSLRFSGRGWMISGA